MNFKIKYLKYKNKYLKLKSKISQKGGVQNGSIEIFTERNSKNSLFIDTNKVFFNNKEICSFKLTQVSYADLSAYFGESMEGYDNTTDSEPFKNHVIIYLSDFYTKYPRAAWIEKVKNIMSKNGNVDIAAVTNEDKKTAIQQFENSETFEDILLKNLKGVPTLALQYALSRYKDKFNKVLLFLEPIRGDNLKGITYKNFYKTNEERYNFLKDVYYKNIMKILNVKKSKTTFQMWKIVKPLGYQLPGTYDMNINFGEIPDYVTNATDDRFDNIGFYEWGLGIENELVLYKDITNNKINVVPLGHIVIIKKAKYTDNLIQTYFNVTDDKDKKLFKFNNINEGNNSDLGGEMVEITTQNFKSNSLDTTLQELDESKNKFLQIVNTKLEDSAIHPLKFFKGEYYNSVKYSNFDNTLIQDEGDKSIYLGSYHFNITLPHLHTKKFNSNQRIYEDNPKSNFLDRHLLVARGIQLMEPLLVAVFGRPDNKSINDFGRKTEASFRLFVSKTTFVGSADLETKISSKRERDYDGTNKIDLLQNDFDYEYNQRKTGHDFRRVGDAEKNRTLSYFGFEFRSMDYFPVEHLKQFTSFIYLLAFYVESNNANFDYDYKDVLVAQLKLCLKEGYNSRIDERYKILIKDKLTELDLSSLTDTSNAYDLLNLIYKKLINYYNSNIDSVDSRILKCYKFIIGTIAEEDLPNYNKDIMFKIIEEHLRNKYGTRYNDKIRTLKSLVKTDLVKNIKNELNVNNLVNFIKNISKKPGLTDPELEKEVSTVLEVDDIVNFISSL